MSSPATPTGTRRRTLLNQSHAGDTIGSSSWLGHLSDIVGDMLQGWGLLGALKGKGNTTKVTSSWNSFGGIGGGLGSTHLSRSSYGSTPSSPMVHSSRHTGQSGAEAIELMPLQNPCYLRIEGLGVKGRGHTWIETKSFSLSPYWCDTCAHLIFTLPITCQDCSYTCHKQCQPLVAIDCRGSSTSSDDKKQPPADELDDSVAGDINDALLADNVEKETRNADLSGGDSDSDSSDYATLGPESSLRSDVCLNTQELQSHILRSWSVESDSKEGEEKHESEEKHEGEDQEKDIVIAESTSLRRAIAGINLSESTVAAGTLEQWVLDSAASQGLQLAKDVDGGYRGCLRVHLNLTRPINIVAGTRPPSIYDILQEDRTLDKTLTSFYMPRNAVKAIHIDSSTTTRQVIVALLRKFKVVDNPQKFALYERSFDQKQTKGRLRRLSDSECPLELAMGWSKDESEMCHRIVLQENDTNDIEWDAFSLPELNNFLRILDREELDYRSQIEEKYQRLREQLERQLEKCG